MAKLPEIKYSIGVQSLGREDIHAPGRLAAAKINSARQIADAAMSFERTVAASEYTKIMGETRTSISDLYDTIVSKEAFTSSEVPEYVSGIERYETVVGSDGQEIIRERVIPASEVRMKWFEQGLKNITNSAVKSSQAPTARTRIRDDLRANINPAAYNQMLTYNRAAFKEEQLAILDSTLQQAVVDGDRLGAEATLARYLVSGMIGAADFEVRQLDISQKMDIEAYSQQIFNAEDEAVLDDLYSQLGDNQSLTMPGESDMTPEQRRYLRQSIDRQEAVFDEERKERHERNDQEGMSMFFEGSLSHGWLNDMAINDGLSPGSLRSLKGLLDTGGRGQSIRDHVMSPFRRQIQRRMYTPEFGEQMSEVVRDVRTGLRGSNVLNPEEQRSLIEYSQNIENQLRATPEIKAAVTMIRAVVGLPEDPDAFMGMPYSQEAIRAREMNAEFQLDLYNYIDEFGAEAKPIEFVGKNKSRYEKKEDPDTSTLQQKLTSNPKFAAYALGPVYSPELTISTAYRDFKRGMLNDEDMYELWNLVYGNVIDIDLLENM